MSFESIRVYKIDKGNQIRVMVTYSSGAAFDEQREIGNLNPIQIDLPATDRGDESMIVSIDTRKVLDARENKISDE